MARVRFAASLMLPAYVLPGVEHRAKARMVGRPRRTFGSNLFQHAQCVEHLKPPPVVIMIPRHFPDRSELPATFGGDTGVMILAGCVCRLHERNVFAKVVLSGVFETF